MADKRVFKTSTVDAYAHGWIADMSDPNGPVNPDAYWRFRTRKEALEFCHLVDSGVEAEHAARQVISHRTPGTAPDTSLYLGSKRRQWLQARGGIQPTIQRMIDDTMQAEN